MNDVKSNYRFCNYHLLCVMKAFLSTGRITHRCHGANTRSPVLGCASLLELEKMPFSSLYSRAHSGGKACCLWLLLLLYLSVDFTFSVAKISI